MIIGVALLANAPERVPEKKKKEETQNVSITITLRPLFIKV